MLKKKTSSLVKINECISLKQITHKSSDHSDFTKIAYIQLSINKDSAIFKLKFSLTAAMFALGEKHNLA